jgi:hypothetical protein
MTALKTSANGSMPVEAPAGTPLLGEVITWNAGGVKVKHVALVEALRGSGLDEKVARELAPRHAFTRACRKLGERRIIRLVSETSNELSFQFTQESKSGDRFEYTLETMLTLDKAAGTVSCALPALATLAQEQLDECIAARNGGDVTRVVQRLFEREADLFPIREKGGCYFVPQRHSGFIDRVGRFITGLGGGLRRFPVPAGTTHGDRSVKEAVACGLASLVEEHRAAVAVFGEDTRESTLERAAARIREARFKVESYSAYLAEERANLEKALDRAADELRAKVASLAEAKATPEEVAS